MTPGVRHGTEQGDHVRGQDGMAETDRPRDGPHRAPGTGARGRAYDLERRRGHFSDVLTGGATSDLTGKVRQAPGLSHGAMLHAGTRAFVFLEHPEVRNPELELVAAVSPEGSCRTHRGRRRCACSA